MYDYTFYIFRLRRAVMILSMVRNS